jgi:hypothetical protein
VNHSFIDAETLRIRTVRRCLGDGQWSEPRTVTDLRGAPMGDKVEVWEWDRLVYPGRSQRGRRVREYIKAMYCPEGWHSTGGVAERPAGPELCATMLDPQWAHPNGAYDREKYHAHHDKHPVVWVIKVKRHTSTRTLRYCDPELPDEYRPGLQRVAS